MAAGVPTAYLLLRFAASHDPPRWSAIPLRPRLPLLRTPIPSTEESSTSDVGRVMFIVLRSLRQLE